MSSEVSRIGIKELIDQVKRELLAEPDHAEPLFLID